LQKPVAVNVLLELWQLHEPSPCVITKQNWLSSVVPSPVFGMNTEPRPASPRQPGLRMSTPMPPFCVQAASSKKFALRGAGHMRERRGLGGAWGGTHKKSALTTLAAATSVRTRRVVVVNIIVLVEKASRELECGLGWVLKNSVLLSASFIPSLT
jgi:hypothetical protein